MWTKYTSKLQDFKTISLTELNSKASFLKRIDKKYLLSYNQLKNIIDELIEDFSILEINGRKIFSYDNIYMDTKDYLFYKQHQEKKKTRTKVRTRYYVNSNLAFFEFKQKRKWVTNKYRYDFPSEEHGFMTRWKKRFFEWVWQSIYENKKIPKITPSIETKYERITLVKNDWSERLTIDYNVRTVDLRDKNHKEVDLKNLVIVESKSLSKKCSSSKIMKKHWHKKTKSCSKYSLWVIYSGLAKKYDTFADTMRQIKKIRMETVRNRKRVSRILKNKQTWSFKRKKLTIKK